MPCHQTGSERRRNLAEAAPTQRVLHSLPVAAVLDPESAAAPMSRYLQILIQCCIKSLKHTVKIYNLI